MLLALVGNTNKYRFSFLATSHSDCISNAIAAFRIIFFPYVCMSRWFFSYEFILGHCLHNILSSEIKFHFCQYDGNEITPEMSFILGYFM